MAANRPRFAVNISGRMGLGAMLSHSVTVFHYCAENGLSPRLMFTNPLYAPLPGEDWLERYFVRREQLGAAEAPLEAQRYLGINANLTRILHRHLPTLTLQGAHDLFTAHMAIREDLIRRVDRLCDEGRLGERTVGVHFRGTDKRLEASRVDWSDMAGLVDRALDQGLTGIFVATDEPEFLTFMRSRFGVDRVTDLDCEEIFAGSAPAHLTAGNPETKAREALEAIVALSRCGLLIRGRSHLSAWAKILNPSLPIVVLGEMLKGDQFVFPENVIKTEVVL